MILARMCNKSVAIGKTRSRDIPFDELQTNVTLFGDREKMMRVVGNS